MKFLSALMIVGLLAWAGSVMAAGSDTTPATTQSPKILDAQKLLEAKRYGEAIPILKFVAQTSPKNADAHNLLGYSLRKTNQLEAAEVAYNRSLEIDPKHRGALEYLGELFLETNRLKEAEKLLQRLDDACLFGCKEYDDLKKEIAEFRAKGG